MECPKCGIKYSSKLGKCPACFQTPVAREPDGKSSRLLFLSGIAIVVVVGLIVALPQISYSSKYKDAVTPMRSGDYLSALGKLERLQDDFPNRTTLRADLDKCRLEVGQLYFEIGRYEDAISVLSGITESSPLHSSAVRVMDETKAEIGRGQESSKLKSMPAFISLVGLRSSLSGRIDQHYKKLGYRPVGVELVIQGRDYLMGHREYRPAHFMPDNYMQVVSVGDNLCATNEIEIMAAPSRVYAVITVYCDSIDYRELNGMPDEGKEKLEADCREIISNFLAKSLGVTWVVYGMPSVEVNYAQK